MRFKVSNRECVHKWANQVQSHSDGPSILHRGKQIYSYGRHFEMGRHVEGSRGRTAVLITTEDRSMTTAKHLSFVRYATNHLTAFHLPLRPLASDISAVALVRFAKQYAESQIRDYIDKASRARSNKEFYLNSARRQSNEFNLIAVFYGNRQRIILPADFDSMLAMAKEQAQKISEANHKRQAELQARAAIEHERRMKEAGENIVLWKAGTLNRFPYQSEIPVCLRLIQNAETIQSTLGAEFPVEHGRRAYRVLARLHEKGQEYQRNGHTLHCGHYAIDRMDEYGIRAGCHRITWIELKDFAKRAGWIDDANDDADNSADGHQATGSRQDESDGRDAVTVSSDSGRNEVDRA